MSRTRYLSQCYKSFFLLLLIAGCTKQHALPPKTETRALEESKAAEIIEEVLLKRGYKWDKDAAIHIENFPDFSCDYRVQNQAIAIEYLTDTDQEQLANLPPPAEGSRLYVLPGMYVSTDETEKRNPRVYVLFIKNLDFLYQVSPTLESRVDVTFLEVDSRLRRDLEDFLTWYENTDYRR